MDISKTPSQWQIKAWQSRVAAHGCVATGEPFAFHLHHVVGRSRRVRVGMEMVHVGEWFIIPLAVELHDVGSNHPDNVTHFPKRFREKYGLQADLFVEMCEELERRGGALPFPAIILEAIKTLKV